MRTLELPLPVSGRPIRRKLVFTERWTLSQYILLTIPGWFFASLISEVLIADLAALFGSIVMFQWIWKRLGNQVEMIRFARLGAAMLVFIQNAAWLTSSIISRTIDRSIEVSLSKNLGGGLTLSSYCIAIIFISLFSCVLAYAGSRPGLLKYEIMLRNRILAFEHIKVQKFAIIMISIMIAETLLITSGIVAQRGLNVAGYDEGDMPAWLVLYESLLPLHIFFNALLFCLLWKNKVRKGKSFLWILLLTSVPLIFFLYFNKGRSTMTFSVFAHAYWAIFFLAKKPNLFRTALICALIYPIVSQAFLLNNFLRSSAAGVSEMKGSAIEVVSLAWDKFEQSEKLRSAEKLKTAVNLSTRPLVATPLALCIQLPIWSKSFTFGKDLLHSLIWAVPGPLIPNKKDFPKQEQLLYAHFPIGSQDTADSLYLSSYVDFGWFGILIYPICLVVLWYLLLSFGQGSKLSPFLYAIIVTTFISLFFLKLGEASITKWLVSARAILFWGLFFYLMQKVLRFRISIFKTLRRKTLSTSI